MLLDNTKSQHIFKIENNVCLFWGQTLNILSSDPNPPNRVYCLFPMTAKHEAENETGMKIINMLENWKMSNLEENPQFQSLVVILTSKQKC